VAVEFLIHELNSNELAATLDAYVAKGHYYYNVVVAIDRSLYCCIRPSESQPRIATPDDYLEFADIFNPYSMEQA
jgi:hypothetical protein